MEDLTIIKIGGNIVDSPAAINEFLEQFRKVDGLKILVHGGGKLASRLCEQLGIPVQMSEGRRITCGETLKVATMVYAGLINKSLTALLNAVSIRAIGLCGADLLIIPSKKRVHETTDFGFVGDISAKEINTLDLQEFLSRGITPVIAPITCDSSGQLLNTNADTIASALAKALSGKYKVTLVFGFEKEGVLENDEVLKTIDPMTFSTLKDRNVISEGMIPKLENAFAALEEGVDKVVIGNASRLDNLMSNETGTSISK